MPEGMLMVFTSPLLSDTVAFFAPLTLYTQTFWSVLAERQVVGRVSALVGDGVLRGRIDHVVGVDYVVAVFVIRIAGNLAERKGVVLLNGVVELLANRTVRKLTLWYSSSLLFRHVGGEYKKPRLDEDFSSSLGRICRSFLTVNFLGKSLPAVERGLVG